MDPTSRSTSVNCGWRRRCRGVGWSPKSPRSLSPLSLPAPRPTGHGQVDLPAGPRRQPRPRRPDAQGELFPAWRYHAVFTDSPQPMLQAEADHRRHAIIEQVIAHLKSGPLSHFRPGNFMANSAWLVLGRNGVQPDPRRRCAGRPVPRQCSHCDRPCGSWSTSPPGSPAPPAERPCGYPPAGPGPPPGNNCSPQPPDHRSKSEPDHQPQRARNSNTRVDAPHQPGRCHLPERRSTKIQDQLLAGSINRGASGLSIADPRGVLEPGHLPDPIVLHTRRIGDVELLGQIVHDLGRNISRIGQEPADEQPAYPGRQRRLNRGDGTRDGPLAPLPTRSLSVFSPAQAVSPRRAVSMGGEVEQTHLQPVQAVCDALPVVHADGGCVRAGSVTVTQTSN